MNTREANIQAFYKDLVREFPDKNITNVCIDEFGVSTKVDNVVYKETTLNKLIELIKNNSNKQTLTNYEN